jgi:hypothetical protein
VVIASLAGNFLAGPPHAAAQKGADYDLQVNAWQCETTACDDQQNLGGAVVEAVDANTGESYGTCTTPDGGHPNTCDITVPGGTFIGVSIDPATIPDGYVPVENPIYYQVPEKKTQVGDVSFTVVPVAESTYDLQVVAFICNDDECSDRDTVDGASFEATDSSGDERYGSCTSSSDELGGGCTIEVPGDAEGLVSLDESTIPDGYAPDENPIEFALIEESFAPQGVRFELYPSDDASEPADPTDEATEPADPTEMASPENSETGYPAAIVDGGCDSFSQSVELTDIAPIDGDPVGSEQAELALTSFTETDVPMSDLLDSDHALVVFDANDDSVVVACGEIGGVPNDGALTFALHAVNDSELTGIGFIAPVPNDSDRTLVTIFIIPG